MLWQNDDWQAGSMPLTEDTWVSASIPRKRRRIPDGCLTRIQLLTDPKQLLADHFWSHGQPAFPATSATFHLAGCRLTCHQDFGRIR